MSKYLIFFIIILICTFRIYGYAGDMIVLDNFDQYKGDIFSVWKSRDENRKEASGTYVLQGDSTNRFLKASSFGNSIQIVRQVKWDINKYNFLSWRWRLHKKPEGANEEARGKNDSGAAIYVLFQRKRIPFLSWEHQPVNVIKYVWSSSLPQGKVVHKEKTKLGAIIYVGKFIVLQSGGEGGGWITEKRNVLGDYKKVFGKSPQYDPFLIGILTDSNDTGTSAIADYDDFIISRE